MMIGVLDRFADQNKAVILIEQMTARSEELVPPDCVFSQTFIMPPDGWTLISFDDMVPTVV